MSINRDIFFERCRSLFHGTISEKQRGGMTAILDEWEKRGISSDLRWLAYIFATAYHETAQTMLPVREAYWLSEDWRRRHLRYYPYYGRGYVQLTWRDGYKKAGAYVKADLVAKPDLALEPHVAAEIAFVGMTQGWFRRDRSGPHTLARYFNASKSDPVGARAIINGREWKKIGGKQVTVASIISGYFSVFLSGLNPHTSLEEFEASVVYQDLVDEDLSMEINSETFEDQTSTGSSEDGSEAGVTMTATAQQFSGDFGATIERALASVTSTVKSASLPDGRPYLFPNGVEVVTLDIGFGSENKLTLTISGAPPKN